MPDYDGMQLMCLPCPATRFLKLHGSRVQPGLSILPLG